MNYSSTSVGSGTRIFTNDTHCYNGSEIGMQRICKSNEEWDGEMVNEDSIAEGEGFIC